MKNIKYNRALIVGAFIFIGLLIFVIAVFTLGGKSKAFAKTLSVKAVFEDVSGLKVGDNVWLSGVKIGTVKKIEFNDKAQVEVLMNIDKHAQHLIKENAKAKISSEGFIGNKIVMIIPGAGAAPQIQKDEYLQVEKAISTDEMLATLQTNNKNLLAITGNFKLISDEIVNGKGSIGALLKDSSLVTQLNSTLANFKKVSLTSKQTMAEIEHFAGQLNKPGTLAQDLVSDTIIMNSIRGSATLIRDAAYSASELADNLNDISYKLYDNHNAAGTLLNDKKVADQLHAIITNLTTSSEKLDENLEALQHNFLLRGYFKKKEKENSTQP